MRPTAELAQRAAGCLEPPRRDAPEHKLPQSDAGRIANCQARQGIATSARIWPGFKAATSSPRRLKRHGNGAQSKTARSHAASRQGSLTLLAPLWSSGGAGCAEETLRARRAALCRALAESWPSQREINAEGLGMLSWRSAPAAELAQRPARRPELLRRSAPERKPSQRSLSGANLQLSRQAKLESSNCNG